MRLAVWLHCPGGFRPRTAARPAPAPVEYLWRNTGPVHELSMSGIDRCVFMSRGNGGDHPSYVETDLEGLPCRRQVLKFSRVRAPGRIGRIRPPFSRARGPASGRHLARVNSRPFVKFADETPPFLPLIQRGSLSYHKNSRFSQNRRNCARSSGPPGGASLIYLKIPGHFAAFALRLFGDGRGLCRGANVLSIGA